MRWNLRLPFVVVMWATLLSFLAAQTVGAQGISGRPTGSIVAVVSEVPIENDNGTFWSVHFKVTGRASANCVPDFKAISVQGSLVRIDTWWPFAAPCVSEFEPYEFETEAVEVPSGTYTAEVWDQELIASEQFSIADEDDFQLDTVPAQPVSGEPLVLEITGVWRDTCVPTTGDVHIAGGTVVVRALGARCDTRCEGTPTFYRLATSPISSLDEGVWTVEYRVVGCVGERLVGQRQLEVMPSAQEPGCIPASDVLCVDGAEGSDGRFRVEISFQTDRAGGRSGRASLVPMSESGLRGGLFWFFDAKNPELLFKLLDGCGTNQHFWTFVTALTDVGYDLVVTDTVTGGRWTSFNEDGQLALPVADVTAFPCD